jgi:hypothetical protein
MKNHDIPTHEIDRVLREAAQNFDSERRKEPACDSYPVCAPPSAFFPTREPDAYNEAKATAYRMVQRARELADVDFGAEIMPGLDGSPDPVGTGFQNGVPCAFPSIRLHLRRPKSTSTWPTAFALTGLAVAIPVAERLAHEQHMAHVPEREAHQERTVAAQEYRMSTAVQSDGFLLRVMERSR